MIDLVERVAMGLCQAALAGKKCPCAESGEFRCADAYPGTQAKVSLRIALEEAAKMVGDRFGDEEIVDAIRAMIKS